MKKIKAFLKEIESYDYDTGQVRVNWFHFQLPSGRVIKVFDDCPFDLRSYVKKYVNILLHSGIYSLHDENYKIDKSKIFEGIFEKTFQLPLEWKDAYWEMEDSFNFYQKYHNILKIPDGVIILSRSEKKLEENGIKEGDTIIVDFGRISLISWYPIDE